MPIESVKIPQNVYIEDRIIGPITLRQIIICLVGGGFSYVMYTWLQKLSGGSLPIPVTIFVWIPAAIAMAFAFVKINDLSLLRFLLLLVEKMNKPASRTWAPRTGLVIHIRTTADEEARIEKERKAKEQAETAQTHTTNKIRELSSILDRPLPAETRNEHVEETQHADETAVAEESAAIAEDTEDAAPRFPVDPGRIRVDEPRRNADDHGGLSAFDGVFRDISPSA